MMSTNSLVAQTKASLTAQEKQVLKEFIYPLRTITPDEGDNTDLTVLHRLVGDAKIVALGEVTHGSGAIFNTKHRLIRQLIGSEGFNIFALEANMPRMAHLNDYLVEGRGDPKELLRQAQYPIWCTEEMLALVEWIHSYNDTHRDTHSWVTSAGFDMLHTQCMLQELQGGFASPSLSADQAEWLKQNLRLLEQSIIYKTVGTDISTWRDFCFADNISWIKEHNTQKKIIVWAHNAHVKKSLPTSAGYYLANQWGEDYVSFGFAFFGGTYTTSDETGNKVTRQADSATPGTYEYLLNQLDTPYFILDLKRLKQDTRPETAWIRQAMLLRHFGFVPKDTQFFQANLTDDYDYLIFLKESVNAHPF
jgi:erythromycin esterase